LVTPDRAKELVDVYRDAGGTAPCVLIRRVWLGADVPTQAVDRQLDVYRGYAPEQAPAHWGSNEMVQSADAATVVAQLADVTSAAGADALNLRVHVPGVAPDAAREQIVRLGDEVVGALRARLGDSRRREESSV
jgi:hypothetical protein